MYQRHWAIEDGFCDIMVSFGLSTFHGRSYALIELEIYSLLAWMTVGVIFERDACRRVERSRGRQNPSHPHRLQIKHSNLYLVAAHLFARLLRTKDIATALAESKINLRGLDSTARRRRPNQIPKW